MLLPSIHLRFYQELNDFLSLDRRKIAFDYSVASGTSVKDVIESLGVPHTEVDLILVNGESVDFSYQVQANDYISIYPMFELFDIAKVTHLRPEPLRAVKFVLDVHLGKLTKYLRLLGFDTFYDNHYLDKDIIKIAKSDNRIILTRDVGLLKHKTVTHGYWLRVTDPLEQTKEIIKKFDLIRLIKPFTRCLECNGEIITIDDQAKIKTLPVDVQSTYTTFSQCQLCHRLYWQGSHYAKLAEVVEQVMGSLLSLNQT